MLVDDALSAALPGSPLLDFVETELVKTYKITVQKDPHTYLGLENEDSSAVVVFREPYVVSQDTTSASTPIILSDKRDWNDTKLL